MLPLRVEAEIPGRGGIRQEVGIEKEEERQGKKKAQIPSGCVNWTLVWEMAPWENVSHHFAQL